MKKCSIKWTCLKSTQKVNKHFRIGIPVKSYVEIT